jgi:hypothetical protein
MSRKIVILEIETHTSEKIEKKTQNHLENLFIHLKIKMSDVSIVKWLGPNVVAVVNLGSTPSNDIFSNFFLFKSLHFTTSPLLTYETSYSNFKQIY